MPPGPDAPAVAPCLIRAATPADCAAIAAIWNPVIRDSLITFTTAEKTAAGLAALIADKAAAGHGVLVAADPTGGIAGFATYGQFRAGPGYAATMEHTIILAPAARRHGIGRALLRATEDHARAGGAHSLFAGVSGGNPAGRDFHTAMGYALVATLPRVGHKFGRWLDLWLMQKFL